MPVIKYYKLTLSLEEIQEILLTVQDVAIRTKLTKMTKKIAADLLKPAYVTDATPKVDLLDLLGEPVDKKAMYDEDSLDDWHAADPNIPD